MIRVRLAELQNGHYDDVLILTIGERRFAVCRTSLGYFVVRDYCPHARLPLTEVGRLKRPGEIQCTAHGCEFNLRTGERCDSSKNGCPKTGMRLDLVQVDQDGDELIVDI